ncbi:hypothetical protein Pse7367_1043 [Thalassoporum mexicanum PCC 7367]|uniref:DUF4132 domain-containing protein n=1 Tax=Thalassoporum mexicanum TaxID=3457544 RepID=UPI00029FD3EB|nr:DUF4132 domain-containing protein [Pseudanabaena sp. PCC 7367]AFY69341.1 hypothetical protein Pse7367_1043 [Pseudanabaena sp. PCC 7367]
MEWWQQMIKAEELANPLGLSAEMLELLAQDFDRFRIMDQNLPRTLINFLVDAEGSQTVLDQLVKVFGQGLNFSSASAMRKWYRYEKAVEKAEKCRGKVFELFGKENINDVDLFCRLAKIYSAEAQVMPMFGAGTIPFGKSAHLDPFLYAAAGSTEKKRRQAKSLGLGIAFTMLGGTIAGGNESSDDDYYGLPEFISFDLLAEMLETVGENPEVLVKSVFPEDQYYSSINALIDLLAQHPQFGAFALKYLDVVQKALHDKEIYTRIHALKILSYPTCQPLVEALNEKVVEMAIGTSKSVRQQAEALFATHRDLLLPGLKQAAIDAGAASRLNAINLLEKLKPEGLQEFLEQRQEQEKSAKVRGAIERILTVPIAQEEEPEQKQELQLPPLPEVKLEAPLPEHVYEAFKQMLKDCDQAVTEYVDRLKKIPSSMYANNDRLTPDKLPDHQINKIWHVLQSGKAKDCQPSGRLLIPFHYTEESKCEKLILGFLESPELEPIHLVRLLLILDEIPSRKHKYIEQDEYDEPAYFGYRFLRYLNHYYSRNKNRFGIRQLEQLLKFLEVKNDLIRYEIFKHYDNRIIKAVIKWEDEAVWPYFAENTDILIEIFTPKVKSSPYDYDYGMQALRELGLEILAKFPTPPIELEPKLWEIALGGSKKESPQAQEILTKLPNYHDRVYAALNDRSNVTGRIAAAQWLERSDGEAAIELIKTTLKTEKNENAKDAYMRILSRLGVSATEFINIDELKAEAAKGLKKGIPDKLSWFPFKQLPTIHWQDSGKPVEKDIIIWFIVKAHKQKLVEPSPIVQLYSSYFVPEERELLGHFILESWIAHDTRPTYSQSEAEKLAKQDMASLWAFYQRWLKGAPANIEVLYEQYYQQKLNGLKDWHKRELNQSEIEEVEEYAQNNANSTWQGLEEARRATKESIYQGFLKDRLALVTTSATKDKGILAIASACCGVAAVPIAKEYLTKWYGRRSAQCMALLQILTWVEDFSAIQYILSVAKRFRSKNIQEAAGKFIEEIAERNGWTPDELGDRTIPTAGFEDKPEMTLDYGARQFTLVLDSQLNLILTDSDRKVLKSLPNDRKDDDADLAKAAKKTYSAAKKQLKQVLKMQTERLYEAMCTQRSWVFRDWQAFLNQHPIMGRLCQRLVWVVCEDGQVVNTFRPLDDGSFTDVEDEEVVIKENATIQIAHDILLDQQAIAFWQAHLSDYEITPLFQQFGKQQYILAEENKNKTEVADFVGYVMDSFSLRSKVKKLGYERGRSTEYCFSEYRKAFPGLGIEALIEFSGSYLPEDQMDVALRSFFFRSLAAEHDYGYYDEADRIPLDEIPTVLLSEIWNDMKQLAEQGSGYREDWEKQIDIYY